VSNRKSQTRLALIGAAAIAAGALATVGWSRAEAASPSAGPQASNAAEADFGTPGTFTYTVPAGVHEVQVEAWGGGGGGVALNGTGGQAGFVRAVLYVNPGDRLHLTVGTGGAGVDPGCFDASKGGATTVTESEGFAAVKAPGGGGAPCPGSTGGAGGAAGIVAAPAGAGAASAVGAQAGLSGVATVGGEQAGPGAGMPGAGGSSDLSGTDNGGNGEVILTDL
jgi:hypothetical protein